MIACDESIDGRLVGRAKMTQRLISEGLSMDGTVEGYWHEDAVGDGIGWKGEDYVRDTML